MVSVLIINHLRAAVLSAEVIFKHPLVIDDAVAARSRMNLKVSFDHRVMDGGAVLRFLNVVKQRLESRGQRSLGL